MFRRHRRDYSKITLIFLVLLIFTLAGLAVAGDIGPLPATHWNQQNLSRIKVPATGPLTFAVFGDNRGENPAVFARLLQEVDRRPDLAFAIHLGDMVKNADLDRYRRFFAAVRLNMHKPLLTVIGNHELYGERGLELFHEMFGPDYYSFQLNNNYFIVINDAAPEGPGPEQLRWLANELQKSQAYKTRLVFLHVPLSDPRGGENHHCLRPEPAARLLALFKKYRVTRVFAAHIHSYYAGAWDGVPYVITGGAGAKLYCDDPKHAFYHYLQVSIRGSQVQIKVRPISGP